MLIKTVVKHILKIKKSFLTMTCLFCSGSTAHKWKILLKDEEQSSIVLFIVMLHVEDCVIMGRIVDKQWHGM
jgi:hypothetical protein